MPIIVRPPMMSNDPEACVEHIFEKAQSNLSRADTRITSLHDWRKGRRAEVAEVNGRVVDVLATDGQTARCRT